jgi:hypothetical protein
VSQGVFPGFGPSVGGRIGAFLSNPLLEQIFVWQVLQQITSTVLTPEMAGLQQEIFKLNSSLQLSIADAVDAVIKSHMTEAEGAAEASLSGIKESRFQTLIASAGEPPGLDFLLQAMRRKFIPTQGTGAEAVSLEQGIRESRLKNKWIPTIELMQWQVAPVGVVVEGWLRAQITEPEARAILAEQGVDDATATLMYKAAGRPPGPMELIDLYRRGVIPEGGEGGDTLSLRQGYLETDLKNKWYDTWRRLSEYLPPPRTVTALLKAGDLTDAEALALFKDAGLSEHLAGVYVAAAHHAKAAGTKELVKAEVMTLYEEGRFSVAETKTHLESLGYDGPTADLEIEVIDWRRAKGAVDKAVSRVRTLYVAHKIDEQHALTDLDNLGVPAGQRDQLMRVWALERADNVAVLTAAEVVHLAKLNVMTEDEALAWLVEHGFDALDAWYRLAVGLGAIPATAKPV